MQDHRKGETQEEEGIFFLPPGFLAGDGFALTLAYPHTDWCSNIMATGKCTLTWKGQEYELEKPELIPMSEAWAAYPPITKLFALAGGETKCLWVHKKQVVPEQEKVLVGG